MTSYEILVDPQRLLLIRFFDAAHSEHSMVALTCAYVTARGASGQLQVAVEIVVDPAMPNPSVAYYCDPQRLEHHVVPPSYLLGIHPYQSR